MNEIARHTTSTVQAAQLYEWLLSKEEIALIDIREEGQFGLEHLLLAVNVPYSRLEAEIRPRVPLLSTRIVIVDAEDGVANKALGILAGLGYSNLYVLEHAVSGWKAAGYQVFEGTNVPSKAFAEVVEVAAGTPHISPATLVQLKEAGRELVILDTRTVEEFSRSHVPGAYSAPGVELQAHIQDLASSPDTLIVVSCAGRTRSIIGAQGLINFGVSNEVVSLAGGTQGWRLAGFDLETSPAELLPRPSAEAVSVSLERAQRLREKHNIKIIDRDALRSLDAESPIRTNYVFDVRTKAEFEAGHIAGARWAAGGQLVQALDSWVGVRNARLVLVDDNGVRATVAAHWLIQMGWDVSILIDPAGVGPLEKGPAASIAPDSLPHLPGISTSEALQWLGAEGEIVSTDTSTQFLVAHPEGAHWASRARLNRLGAKVLNAPRILVVGDDRITAALIAADLQASTPAEVRVLAGGTQAWRSAQLPTSASAGLKDSDRIDYLFWNHMRQEGNFDAMRAYLKWELDLPPRITADGTARFALSNADAANRRVTRTAELSTIS